MSMVFGNSKFLAYASDECTNGKLTANKQRCLYVYASLFEYIRSFNNIEYSFFINMANKKYICILLITLIYIYIYIYIYESMWICD